MVAPLIFSGYNERAVLALCRFLDSLGRPFFLVAKSSIDSILGSKYNAHVIYTRESIEINSDLIIRIGREVFSRGCTPALCPTSEFLNDFVLDNSESMKSDGWKWTFPPKETYRAISEKGTSPYIFSQVEGVLKPTEQESGFWRAPCVLKPRVNISNGRVLYPILCKDSSELNKSMGEIERTNWYCQEWINGQSYYLLAYIDTAGNWSAAWQENLLQQPGGKSIVLARTCANPGVPVKRIMAMLNDMAYRGPIMIEFLVTCDNRLYFIEANPRFWGPLELVRLGCSSILHRYISDLDGLVCGESREENCGRIYYAWERGARVGPLHRYPSARQLSDRRLRQLIAANDLYEGGSEQDTIGPILS